MIVNEKYLPKSDVVFTVMFLNKELCEMTLRAILGEEIDLIDLVAEYKNDLHKAATNSIYFDIKTASKDGRIITLDLQRKYKKDRIRNRTVYYACRKVSDQKVAHGRYEDLRNVVVSFILTEAPFIHTSDNKKIQLYDHTTQEVYSDLLTVYEVNMRHVSEKNSLEFRALRDFFAIENQQAYEEFVKRYGDSHFGSLLISEYSKAIKDSSLLDVLSEEGKFMIKLTDEERLYERESGKREGKQEERIEIATNLLKENVPFSIIIKTTGLSNEEIEKLQNAQ